VIDERWIADGCAMAHRLRHLPEAARILAFVEKRVITSVPRVHRFPRIVCDRCGELFHPWSEKQAQRYCSASCRVVALREAAAERDESLGPDAPPYVLPPLVERIAGTIRREPDLENWQLEERFGADRNQVWEARRLAGIHAPPTLRVSVLPALDAYLANHERGVPA